MLLTVIIPTTDRPESLKNCLLSVLDSQQSSDYEIKIVNNTPHINSIINLKNIDSSVSIDLLNEPVLSVGRARNMGIRESSSELIAFTDDDCITTSNWTSSIINFMKKNPEISCAGGLVIDPARNTYIYKYMKRINYMEHLSRFKYRSGGFPSLGCANMVVRKSALEDVGLFNEELYSGEDFELLVRLAQKKHRIMVTNEISSVIHYHQTSYREFAKRYISYGKGIAQVVSLHNLDFDNHRVYIEANSLIKASIRFAKEDLEESQPLPDSNWFSKIVDLFLAFLRAVAWQHGAKTQLKTLSLKR